MIVALMVPLAVGGNPMPAPSHDQEARAAPLPALQELDMDAKLLELFSLWYGTTPATSFRPFSHVTSERFQQLWTTLWFAKGALTAPLDAQLTAEYAGCFDAMAPFLALGAPAPPARLAPPVALMWTVGAMVLCDQLSRNIFRGSARAYATDALAMRLARTLLPRFDELPLPVRVSIVLVFVHSEEPADWGLGGKGDPKEEGKPAPPAPTAVSLLAHVHAPLRDTCPFVLASLSAIVANHGDRMRLFGRVPERNGYLGRASTEQELVYVDAMRT